MSVEEPAPPSRRLSKEEEERLVSRLYTDSVEKRQRKLEELDRRFYPVAEPVRLSAETIQQSVKRQVDQEVELRRTRRAVAEAAAPRTTNPVTNERASGAAVKLTPADVEESVKRMYEETLQKKQANLEESKRRYAPPPPKSKRVSKEELAEWVEKSSKPKQTEFTIEEVNKVYGL